MTASAMLRFQNIQDILVRCSRPIHRTEANQMRSQITVRPVPMLTSYKPLHWSNVDTCRKIQ